MRLGASGTAALAFVLAAVGLLAMSGTARAQLGKAAAAPEPAAAEPVRALLQVDPPAGKDVAGGADAIWQRTIATHVTLLRDLGLLRSVVASDEVRNTGWYGQFKGDGAEAKAAAALARALIVRPVQDTSLIEVRPMIEPAANAAVIANAVCEQYVLKRRDQQYARLTREAELLQKQLAMVKIELNEEVFKQVDQTRQELGLRGVILSAKPGTDIVFDAVALELQEVIRARAVAETDRDATKHAAAAPDGAAEKIARQNAEERVTHLAARQEALQTRLAELSGRMFNFGLLNERMTELRRQQNSLNERIGTLFQVDLQRPDIDVRIAARATPG
jgi:hypothetical protein